jgi:hypothetical protein
MATPTLPVRSPAGPTSISVVGGENLFYIAARYLGDATQWWRIAALNSFPGEPPDFIVNTASGAPPPGQLLLPSVNPNATDP